MIEDTWKFAERYEAALAELKALETAADGMRADAVMMSGAVEGGRNTEWFRGRAAALHEMETLIHQSLSKLTEGAE